MKSSAVMPLGFVLCSGVVCQPFPLPADQTDGEASFRGLGALPDGANGEVIVSGDGNVVVGQSRTATGYQAFRWTQSDGMIALGDLPVGASESMLRAISADGEVVVGNNAIQTGTYTPSPCCQGCNCNDGFGCSVVYEAFIWDRTNGTRNLRDVLVNDYGLDLAGWTLGAVTGMSDDGSVIVGNGTNPDGQQERWIVRLPGSVE